MFVFTAKTVLLDHFLELLLNLWKGLFVYYVDLDVDLYYFVIP